MLERIVYNIKKLFKKPFKVGIIVLDYYNEKKGGGGVSIHAYHISRELAKLGCEVHVFTKEERKFTKNEYIGEGKLVIHGLKIKNNLPIEDKVVKKRMAHLLFENIVIQAISKENSNEKFDILHTHNLIIGGALVSKYFHDIPWVNTAHSVEKNRVKYLEEEEKKYLNLVKWSEGAVRYADALIAVSQNLRVEILKNYPIDQKKVFYIPNGVDLSLFNTLGLEKREKKILYVGRFSLEKGIDIVYKIAKKILEGTRDIKFEIVAPTGNVTESMQDLREKFDELEKRFPERFIWHKERLRREEMKRLYCSSIIFIQPSRYEAFGMTSLEAMACGNAVICSNKGGLPEVIDNAGKVVPLRTNLFVREILRLIKDYRLRERYARRAIRRAEIFDWRDIGLKTLNLYKEVINSLQQAQEKKEKEKEYIKN